MNDIGAVHLSLAWSSSVSKYRRRRRLPDGPGASGGGIFEQKKRRGSGQYRSQRLKRIGFGLKLPISEFEPEKYEFRFNADPKRLSFRGQRRPS
jgi:hypothetical protein